MNTSELDFDLPEELIAQSPSHDRSGSRLLHYGRSDRSIAHRQFSELPDLLRPGDLLVVNDARVIPARFTLQKPTGGLIDGLFIEQRSLTQWRVMLRNLCSSTPTLHFVDAPEISAKPIEKSGGEYLIEVSTDEPAAALLERIGRMPLPPYIHRNRDHDVRDDEDRQRYQTVYAKESGSVAAPTAGLHFTPEILARLDQRGVERASVTLHVGLGTFKPVSTERLEDHPMHVESYSITQTTAEALNAAKTGKRRIVAVGTTSARVLESQPADTEFVAKSSQTGILIYPPYHWKHVDALITNFHLPRSTLIALVAAMVDLDEQRRIYAEAIRGQYRFFSYGDAMLIE